MKPRKPKSMLARGTVGAKGEYAMDVKNLADELIERCCGGHLVGLIYRFLLQAFRNDASAARAEFERFLAGELSQQFLNAAARRVEEECKRDGRKG
jgi:hypothetical protein